MKNEILTEFRQSINERPLKAGTHSLQPPPGSTRAHLYPRRSCAFIPPSINACKSVMCCGRLSRFKTLVYLLNRHNLGIKNDFEKNFNEIQSLSVRHQIKIQGRFKTGINFDVMGVVKLYHGNHIYNKIPQLPAIVCTVNKFKCFLCFKHF